MAALRMLQASQLLPLLEAPQILSLLARPAAVTGFLQGGGAQHVSEERCHCRRRSSVASMAKPQPNPLSGRSLPELREMLLRQERLLDDRAVVSQLPDGGKRVRECAARLREAVAERERRASGGAPDAAALPAGLAGALAGLSLAAEEGGLRGAGARPGGAPQKEKRRPEDASAARMPPLRHAPARLLPLAESVAIQARQEEARQEMQAKVAAQKLAERIGIKVVHYEPEGQMMTGYREVRDEEGDSSAED